MDKNSVVVVMCSSVWMDRNSVVVVVVVVVCSGV